MKIAELVNDGTSDFKNKSFIVNLPNRNKDNDYHYMTESYQSPSVPVTSHSGHIVIGPGHMPVRQIDTLNSAVVPTSVVGALVDARAFEEESPGNRSANAHDMVEVARRDSCQILEGRYNPFQVHSMKELIFL